MGRLRRLDQSVTKPGTIVSLIAGIIIGILGIVGMIAAYPIYAYITKKQREKLAPDIIRLTDELMK